MASAHSALGWRCAVCGTDVGIAEATPWRCPRSTSVDRHHLLQPVVDRSDRSADAPPDTASDDHPFVRFDADLVWAASAAARGMGESQRRELIVDLDERVHAVAGVGFHETPCARSDALSDALGFVDGGGVWVKDETGAVGGSQKSRHLLTILLQLLANEAIEGTAADERPPLAIASCGNAALAAATLARAAEWPIDVFVPTWMGAAFGDELDRLDARVHRCERRADDPPGDPAMHRFRDAVGDGATPFTVQGPENALCLDGGRTIGWELAGQTARMPGLADGLDAVFVQVGGGAFASCLGAGLTEAEQRIPLFAVQAEGCAPLARAWERDARPESLWAEVMEPWSDPASLADGILDDETYDWIGVVDAMRATGGAPIVAAESRIVRAWELAKQADLHVSPTGSAGLAGLLELLDAPGGDRWRRRRVAIVASGVLR